MRDIVDPSFSLQEPLSSLWSQIKISYALGLIPDWAYSDLEILREIRNMFAHTYHNPSFTNEEVAALVRKLRGPVEAIRNADVGSPIDIFPQTSNAEQFQTASLRKLNREHVAFILGISYLAGFLQGFHESRTSGLVDSNQRNVTPVG